MTLTLIGIGLANEEDITLKGLHAVQKADVVYLETYTSLLQCPVSSLEKIYGKKIILANRTLVEQKAQETILKDALTKNVAFLVIGDALSATTHTDLCMRAREKGIKVHVIHNASILTAVGAAGLQLYKFGKTTSIPFPEKNHQPQTAYDVIAENKERGLHTLVLLDLRPDENKFMTITEALAILLSIEEKRKHNLFTKETRVIGCARIGSDTQHICYDTIEKLQQHDFGTPIHCLIIPGTLHFAEEDFLETLYSQEK